MEQHHGTWFPVPPSRGLPPYDMPWRVIVTSPEFVKAVAPPKLRSVEHQALHSLLGSTGRGQRPATVTDRTSTSRRPRGVAWSHHASLRCNFPRACQGVAPSPLYAREGNNDGWGVHPSKARGCRMRLAYIVAAECPRLRRCRYRRTSDGIIEFIEQNIITGSMKDT